MGAKQSKRSVDISGKEAESAGEVAAAGAGGEGRVEQLADADSLKPQLNGDAHIHEQETDKEKILDSGTPENEKDATTEKEKKPEEDNEAAPVTNGDSEPANKTENGESTPATEEVKKPKKEKVKKKWSLRSISFSRKDKPKQEKKTKDDEQKTNGDPEKVPEEAADLPAEPVVTEVAEEAPVQTEVKEEKTPETPVTEPITNGSSTPESVVEESPATSPLAEVVAESVAPVDTAAPTNGPAAPDAPAPEPATLEAAAPTVPAVPAEPENLPINGLSLEEPKLETPQVEVNVQKEPEELTAQVTENAPAPDISVKKEVCVEQMPLIEPTPPPLPANPPPSSVASFAATTMAPELADASLANTAENSVSAQAIDPDTKDPITETSLEPLSVLTDPQTVSTDLPPPTQVLREQSPLATSGLEAEHTNKVAVEEPILEQSTQEVEVSKIEINVNEFNEKLDEVNVSLNDVNEKLGEVLNTPEELPAFSEPEVLTEPISDESQDIVDLPPPPPLVDDNTDSAAVATEKQADVIDQEVHLAKDIIITAHHTTENETVNGFEKEHVTDDVDTEQENVKNKAKDSLGNVLDTIECNGNLDDLNTVPTEEITEMAPPDQCPPNGECVKVASVEEPLPPPPPASATAEPAHAATPQEPIAVCDKMADLIPEIPSVPELITETLQETTSDVAVAN